METNIDLRPETSELERAASFPAPNLLPAPVAEIVGYHRGALIAAAIFTAGLSAFVIMERESSPWATPTAPSPDVALSPAAEAELPQPVLLPYSTERSATPFEEALIPLLLRDSTPAADLKFHSIAELAAQSPVSPMRAPVSLGSQSKRLRQLASWSGLFKYGEALPGHLLKVAMVQTREVWMLGRREEPAPVIGRTLAAAQPAPAPVAAPRRARIFRSATRGVAGVVVVAGRSSSFASAQAAPSSVQQSIAGAIGGGGALVTGGVQAVVRAAPIRQAAGGILAALPRAAAARPARPAAPRNPAPVAAQMPAPNDGMTLRARDGTQVKLNAGWSLEDLQKAEANVMARDAGLAKNKQVVGWTPKCLNMSCNNAGPSVEVRYADGTKEDLKFDPLVLDLAGAGFKAGRATIEVDLTGSGKSETVNDLPAGSGLLVFNAKGGGDRGALGMFGGAADVDGDGKPDGYGDGFEALAALALRASRDGVISPRAIREGRLGPVELDALGRSYGVAIRVGSFASPARSLASAGVRELRLAAPRSNRRENAFDGQGNDVTRRSGAVFTRMDGSTGEYADLWLTPRRLKAVTLARGR